MTTSSKTAVIRFVGGETWAELDRVLRDAQGRVVSGWVTNGAWALKADHDKGICWPEEYPHRATPTDKFTGWAE